MRFANRHLMWMAFILALAPLLAVAQPQPAAAAGVVTECTENALQDAVAGGGEVSFQCSGTITLSSQSQLVLTQNTSIDGGGKVTLSGPATAGETRLLMIPQGVEVTLSGLTLSSGDSSSSDFPGYGGAIYNAGQLTILHSTLSNNHGTEGGAIYNAGGAGLEIHSSVLTNNSAGLGGAIANDGALMLKGSTLAGNGATRPAGAGGAALVNGDSGYAFITNSTFTGNDTLANGGAIFTNGHVEIYASTLVGNNAFGGSAISNYHGEVEVTASILGGSGRSGACGGDTGVISGSSNVVSDHSCNLTFDNDLQGVDPRLGPLADNNGITPTMLPQPGSPALFNVPNATCASLSAENNGVDQRGNPRPVGDAPCDSGSAEVTFEFEWCGWKTGRSPEPPELNGWEC